MIQSVKIPGLFITATDTGVGKTIIAAAIANWFFRRGRRVGVCKIAATGCIVRDGELVSEDAEVLSAASGARFPLNVICPIRYTEPLAPAVAADRAGQAMDWSLLQASLDTLASRSDVLIVEGVGGTMVPMDDRHMVLDVARWAGLPCVVVARAGLGTINHTLLTVNARALHRRSGGRGGNKPFFGSVERRCRADQSRRHRKMGRGAGHLPCA